MKKRVLSALLFILGFIISYLIMCYLPNFRIKLAAAPLKYFIDSLKHMVLFKSIVSLIIGFAIGSIPILIKRQPK